MEPLIIVTPGRAGSEFLLRSLNSNPNFSLDGEVFNRANFEDTSFNHYARGERPQLNYLFNRARLSRLKFNIGLKMLVRMFLTRYQSGEIVQGFKLTLDQLEAYPMLRQFLRKGSTRVLYLTSENKLRMCLSLIKARATNHYHSEKRTKSSEFTFDPKAVVTLYRWVISREEAFLSKFQTAKVVRSEALFSGMDTALSNIAEWIGLGDDAVFQHAKLNPTNPSTLEDWVLNLDQVLDAFKKSGINLSS